MSKWYKLTFINRRKEHSLTFELCNFIKHWILYFSALIREIFLFMHFSHFQHALNWNRECIFFPTSVKSNKQQHSAGSQSSHSKSVLDFVREDGKNEYLPCGINFLFNVLQKAFGKCPTTQMYVNTIHNLFSWAERGVCKIMTRLVCPHLLVAGESLYLYLHDLEAGSFQSVALKGQAVWE